MKISDNKVLITGGNKGIGLVLAKKFLKLKNQVIITGRNETDLAKVKEEFSDIFTFICDISKQEDLDNLTLYIEKEHSDLNILINNAGVQYNYTFLTEQHVLNKIDYETTVNFLAPVKLTAMLLPTLEQNQNPSIINVSSALAVVPKKEAPIYCANKAGIHAFSKALRLQLEEVKVFEIIPSLVDTAMTKGRGKNKISPEELADEFMVAFEKNRYEVKIGKVKLLFFLNRISAILANKIINKN